MYFRKAPQLRKYIDKANTQIKENAFLYSFFGRKRRLPESQSANRAVASHATRSGVNFLVQSVASDINMFALIDAMQWIEDNQYDDLIIPFAVVHDSIVAEVRLDMVDLWKTKLLEFIQTDRGVGIPGCPIKADFEIGPSWGEVKGD